MLFFSHIDFFLHFRHSFFCVRYYKYDVLLLFESHIDILIHFVSFEFILFIYSLAIIMHIISFSDYCCVSFQL